MSDEDDDHEGRGGQPETASPPAEAAAAVFDVDAFCARAAEVGYTPDQVENIRRSTEQPIYHDEFDWEFYKYVAEAATSAAALDAVSPHLGILADLNAWTDVGWADDRVGRGRCLLAVTYLILHACRLGAVATLAGACAWRQSMHDRALETARHLYDPTAHARAAGSAHTHHPEEYLGEYWLLHAFAARSGSVETFKHVRAINMTKCNDPDADHCIMCNGEFHEEYVIEHLAECAAAAAADMDGKPLSLSGEFLKGRSQIEIVENAIIGGSPDIVDMCWPSANGLIFATDAHIWTRRPYLVVFDRTELEELREHVLKAALRWNAGAANPAKSHAVARLALEQSIPPEPAHLICVARGAPGDPYVERYFAKHFAKGPTSPGWRVLAALEAEIASVSVLAALAAASEARRHEYED